MPGDVPTSTKTADWSRSAPLRFREPIDGAFDDHTGAETSLIEQESETASVTGSDAIGRRPLPWWRRRRSLIVVGTIGALALNMAVTAVTWQLLADQFTPVPAETATDESPFPSGQRNEDYAPAPDFVLAVRSDGVAADQPDDPGGKLDALGISPGELKRYEDFRGPEVWSINVWSGESRYGMSCLLVAVANQPISDGGRAAEGCSLKGQDTIADITGTTRTRSVLKGDHVDVYVYEHGTDPNGS